jgi:hypothetical protein
MRALSGLGDKTVSTGAAAGENTTRPTIGLRQDVVDGLLNGVDVVGVLVGDLNAELLRILLAAQLPHPTGNR